MAINKHVFGSAGEKRAFDALGRQWGNKFRIYHNLPFLNVITTEGLLDFHGDLRPITVSRPDRDRLKKTSIDFTLCDASDAPVLCIEFDGLRKGFNVGTTYTTRDSEIRPGWRKSITELKLRVAHGSGMPFIVLCSSYFERISSRTQLTVVDGIIGDYIATQAASDEISRGFKPEDIGFSQDEFAALSPEKQHDNIQSWVINIGIEADMTHNPICQMNAQLMGEIGFRTGRLEPLTHPPIEHLSGQERLQAFENAKLHGARYTVTDEKGRKFTGEIFIPNIKVPKISQFGLLHELAELIAMDKAARHRAKGKN